MRVLLISTYELGHQPLHVASPAARLRADGHDVRTVDLFVEAMGEVEWADAAAISVPMHTAMRLAHEVARDLRVTRPELPVCLYGLYALAGDEPIADRRIAGEYEAELVAWVDELAAGRATQGVSADLKRGPSLVPARDGLPGLDRYAALEAAGERRIAGYVEASRGCRFRCRHCPVPAVYDGTFRIVAGDVVLDDIAQLVAMGARHVTFGDPDFLNGPKHSLRVIRAMHERFPDLSFDATTKVELILRHREIWPELAASGLQFVVSAFETTNDGILRLLDKGHTAADMTEAVHLLRRNGIAIRPSWLPFTPFTSLDDLVDIVTFIDTHRLDVDPIQLTIRLLIPDGSLLLDLPEIVPYLDEREPLGWRWHAGDPAVDNLAARLARIVERRFDDDPHDIYRNLRTEIFAAAGREVPELAAVAPGPRLTEPWFC